MEEPQPTHKGKDHVHCPSGGAGGQPYRISAFQKREKILHLNRTVALRQLNSESSLWELAARPRLHPSQSSCLPVTKGSWVLESGARKSRPINHSLSSRLDRLHPPQPLCLFPSPSAHSIRDRVLSSLSSSPCPDRGLSCSVGFRDLQAISSDNTSFQKFYQLETKHSNI